MKITVSNQFTLNGIPSGSGIAKCGDMYFVIGDDSPYLFSLDKAFKIIDRTPLLDSVGLPNKRIIKSEKPDFESIEMINENELVIFGSGSKSPQRNIFIRVLLGDGMTIEKYDLSDFYDKLKNLPMLKGSELNIEATAFRNNHLFLFNRKKNLIMSFDYQELIAYIKGERTFPKPEIKQFILPKINGVEAGFSGATVLQGQPKMIFTASVENTDNAYDDGEILGSFIGMIDISNNSVSDIFEYCPIPNTEVKLKVESVTIEEEISTGKTQLLLITDDDLGNSMLLESTLQW